MNMTELMKRYEAETGHNAFLTYGITQAICYPTYVEWLEEQLSNQTVEKFQEIIRNQCDEISALKAQLTWRPVSEKPEKAGVYFVEARPYTGCDSTIITTAYFDGERFPWHDVVRWLPIPPQGE